ncbi:dynein light chain Tctex-type protein 2B isoform X1 [Macaca fascicularis]|uniref:dynein light chain Tctex-type protein 2B isoform X1 n=1 Tax=Macaca fascicularis TaxID=9541 RepID=UPI0032B02DC6
MGSLPARELHVCKVLPGGIRRPLDHRTETFPGLRLTGQSRGHSAGFRPSVVKDCIHAVLKEELANAQYSPEEMPQLTKHLSENIKDKLKEMGFDRYKMVVQVVIGEQRGEGVLKDLTLSSAVWEEYWLLTFSMASRCFWDADTDNYTHDVFMNDSLFCVVAAFGCFYY